MGAIASGTYLEESLKKTYVLWSNIKAATAVEVRDKIIDKQTLHVNSD
ncbi:MAG: hypothetical protein HY757_01275 [Nitrospirae bacterium]|nr:hypothetical protein [Nitrospirota bacterium]